MSQPRNQVLTDDAKSSRNFFESDRILRHYLEKHVSGSGLEYMSDKLHRLGEQAAIEMDPLSRAADKNGPRLRKRTPLGNPSNEVEFHPAYMQLLDVAAESEMFYVQYEPRLRDRFSSERHQLAFAAGHLYAMSELGVYCPLCMTDGAARLVDRYAGEEMKERLLPRLTARKGHRLYTGAMFLTEKSGGSDVGRTITRARHIEGDRYKLKGEKWFCSNVNAQVIMALARTGPVEAGTRGLSLFLVEKTLPDGRSNPMEVIRLKDKLGVRSMATGEVAFNDTIGIRLGEENNGFKLMTEMINISRTYNAVAAVAASRRALVEAYQYLQHRITFQKAATEHALVRRKLHELAAGYTADFMLVWRTIRTMDGAEEQGAGPESPLMRILVPMAKWRTAERSVYVVRECMELMGGNGYIEDFVMPKLLRDVNVLPIWEGAGNIIVLDMLRAARKSEGLSLVMEQIRQSAGRSQDHGELMNARLDQLQEVWNNLQQSENREQVEATARPLFEQLITLYQMALLVEETDKTSRGWTRPALGYLAGTFDNSLRVEQPIAVTELDGLMGWKY